MKLYFVRHGETIDNAKRHYQNNNSLLSKLGRQQAQILAKRLQNFTLDSILCSPFRRTRETGQIINERLHKQIKYTKLLSEIKRPTELDGKPKDDPQIKKIVQTIKDNFHNPAWRYSDEETFLDIRKKAISFIDFIKPYQKQNILVISHSFFISAIVAVLMFGDKVTSQELFQWMYFAIMENTGISLCQYSKKGGWRLVVWNDHTHFGDLY